MREDKKKIKKLKNSKKIHANYVADSTKNEKNIVKSNTSFNSVHKTKRGNEKEFLK